MLEERHERIRLNNTALINFIRDFSSVEYNLKVSFSLVSLLNRITKGYPMNYCPLKKERG